MSLQAHVHCYTYMLPCHFRHMFILLVMCCISLLAHVHCYTDMLPCHYRHMFILLVMSCISLQVYVHCYTDMLPCHYRHMFILSVMCCISLLAHVHSYTNMLLVIKGTCSSLHWRRWFHSWRICWSFAINWWFDRWIRCFRQTVDKSTTCHPSADCSYLAIHKSSDSQWHLSIP